LDIPSFDSLSNPYLRPTDCYADTGLVLGPDTIFEAYQTHEPQFMLSSYLPDYPLLLGFFKTSFEKIWADCELEDTRGKSWKERGVLLDSVNGEMNACTFHYSRNFYGHI
jgi:hypothetical protein